MPLCSTKMRERIGCGAASSNTVTYEKAFREAAHIVRIDKMHFHRFSSTPLGTSGDLVSGDARDEHIYYWCNNSFPSFAMQFIAAHLGVPIDRDSRQTSISAAAFGIKITSYPQFRVPRIKKSRRPPRQVDRDALRAPTSRARHGNERTFRDTRVALDKDGVITAIDSRHMMIVVPIRATTPRLRDLAQVFPGVYRFRNARIDFSRR